MQNLLHDMCVKTKRLGYLQKEIAEKQAEVNAISVDLALLASQCYQIRSEEK